MGSRKTARSRPDRGSAQNFAAVLMEATVVFFFEHVVAFEGFFSDVVFPDPLPPEGAPPGS